MGISEVRRWHPEVAVRYLPVVREIRKLGKPSILEVGSGGLGIAPYLGQKVVGLDKSFTPPIHPLLTTKIGSGEHIPFPDKSFDVVVAMDVLEHLLREKRKKVILEMGRVARKLLVIGVPTGEEARKQDKLLAGVYREKHGADFPFFLEHREYGLPEREEIRRLVKDGLDKRIVDIKVIGNEPLKLREFLMKGWMTKSFWGKVFYWKILLLAIPLFRFFDRSPYYRTIFFVKLKS